MTRVTAVVLDLDGTLVDTAPDLVGTLNTILGDAGRDELSLERMSNLVSGGARGLMRTGFALTGEGLSDDAIETRLPTFLEIYAGRLSESSRPYAGVVETLSVLRDADMKLGVCTNKPHGLANQLLDELELSHWFDALLGGDSLDVKKPHPHHIEATLAAIGGATGEAVMVGDSIIDVDAAKGAGVPVIIVGYGYGIEKAREAGADAEIANFSELPDAIAALG